MQFNTLNSAFNPVIWQNVSQKLLAKMLSEFLYEEIISPEIVEQRDSLISYQLNLPEGIGYKFQAKNVFLIVTVFCQNLFIVEKTVSGKPLQVRFSLPLTFMKPWA